MRLVQIAALAGATLVLSACGGSSESGNQTVEDVDSNIMFEQLGNDASALEAAAAGDPLASQPIDGTGNGSVAGDSGSSSDSENRAAGTSGATDSQAPVFGETQGGDTGGNTAQGNSTGQ